MAEHANSDTTKPLRSDTIPSSENETVNASANTQDLIPRDLPDIQSKKPPVKVPLTRVGLGGIKKRVPLTHDGDKHEFEIILNTFVDLPDTNRGIHMSRNLEVLNSIINNLTRVESLSLPSFALRLAEELVKIQTSATRGFVELETNVYYDQFSPSTNKQVQTHAHVILRAEARLNGRDSPTYILSATTQVEGMTVCPCSLAMTRAYVLETMQNAGISFEKAQNLLNEIPLSAHNQRSLGEITITLQGNEAIADAMPRFEEVAHIIEKSMSSPIYELLKRPDEHVLVVKAHLDPVFVEDVVRRMLKGIYDTFKNKLPIETEILVRQRNYESIHPYDAIAEETVSFETLQSYFAD